MNTMTISKMTKRIKMSNLKLYRITAGYSVGDMAECLGVTKRQYENMENGKSEIPVDAQIIITGLIAEGLGEFIDPIEIFYDCQL